MAENKKSFVLYSDVKGMVDQLPDEVAGKLFKHIYAYVNDENPVSDNVLLNIAFEPIKMQLKRDLIKWRDSVEVKSYNGRVGNLKRYNPDLYNRFNSGKITLEKAEDIAKSRKVSQGDSEPSQPVANLAVNDNVTVNVINKEKATPQSIDWSVLILQFNEITGKKTITVPEKAKKQFIARLKDGYTKQNILDAIINCAKDPYHIENGLKHLTYEFISRPDKMEKFCTMQPVKLPKPKQDKL